MSDRPTYRIVVATHASGLEEAVAQLLRDGYTCCGGPFVERDAEGATWYQAVALAHPEPAGGPR